MKQETKTNYREFLTIKSMIEIYCNSKHKHHDGLCPDCNELLEYAKNKLKQCPFKANKPACKDCKIHCYQKNYASRIIEVMKFSGPRMAIKHPVLSAIHLLKSQSSTLKKLQNAINSSPILGFFTN